MNKKIKALIEALKFLASVLQCRSKCCTGSECVCGDVEFKPRNSELDEVISVNSTKIKCRYITEV